MWDGTKDVRTETIPHSELIYALEIPVGKATVRGALRTNAR
jgi:hypothetical protein